MSLPALQRTVYDLVTEYEEKAGSIDGAIADFDTAFARLEMAATVQGVYAGSIGSRPYFAARALKDNLLKSGWKAIWNRLNIETLASARDKALFEKTLAMAPPLTFENAKATFGDYLLRPRFHILRGLAEVFCDLDPAYRSHSKVKIGVKGLPKRVILQNVGQYGSYGRNKLRDVLNALAAYNDEPLIENSEFVDLDALHRFDGSLTGDVIIRGTKIRKFSNGNAHLFFDGQQLIDINKALAEFYGEVLPDAEDDDCAPRESTSVSNDLQFYWSPKPVAEAACDFAGIIKKDQRRPDAPVLSVLEPSCGDGRLLDEIRDRGYRGFGIEYHEGRAAQARANGHKVMVGNFLDLPPSPDFDIVLMNPPFYRKHYLKHVRHAVRFLKPGGTLVAILPATARYDHGELQGKWQDLPVASFSAAGTNVPTCLYRVQRPH